MIKKTIILFLIIAPFLFPRVASADVNIPSMTLFYFDKDGKPYNSNVNFTISCYGRNFYRAPGEPTPREDQLENVFSLSASCPNYGCQIDHPFAYKADIKYCDLVGETEGKKFKIEKYSDVPRDGSKCISLITEKDKPIPTGMKYWLRCEMRFQIPVDNNTISPSQDLSGNRAVVTKVISNPQSPTLIDFKYDEVSNDGEGKKTGWLSFILCLIGAIFGRKC